jgi:hypothetical protein
MIEVTEYELSTGKLIGVIQASSIDYIEANQREGYAYVSGAFNTDDFYIVDNQIVSRPEYSLSISPSSIRSNNSDVVNVSGLPSSEYTVRLFGPVMDSWQSSESSFQLTTNMAGQFMVEIDCWPYKIQRGTFNAS